MPIRYNAPANVDASRRRKILVGTILLIVAYAVIFIYLNSVGL